MYVSGGGVFGWLRCMWLVKIYVGWRRYMWLVKIYVVGEDVCGW